jgi:hypothetical protein
MPEELQAADEVVGAGTHITLHWAISGRYQGSEHKCSDRDCSHFPIAPAAPSGIPPRDTNMTAEPLRPPWHSDFYHHIVGKSRRTALLFSPLPYNTARYE